jgi:hypothetical protein
MKEYLLILKRTITSFFGNPSHLCGHAALLKLAGVNQRLVSVTNKYQKERKKQHKRKAK